MVLEYLPLTHQLFLVVEFALSVAEETSEMEDTHMGFVLVSSLFRSSGGETPFTRR